MCALGFVPIKMVMAELVTSFNYCQSIILIPVSNGQHPTGLMRVT